MSHKNMILQLQQRVMCFTRGKVKNNNNLVSNFYNKLKNSRSFLPPVSQGEKYGKFQFVVEIVHKAIILISLSL